MVKRSVRARSHLGGKKRILAITVEKDLGSALINLVTIGEKETTVNELIEVIVTEIGTGEIEATIVIAVI